LFRTASRTSSSIGCARTMDGRAMWKSPGSPALTMSRHRRFDIATKSRLGKRGQMPSGYITVDRGRLNYSDVGRGPRTIVWIHGLPLNGDAWRAQVDHFSAIYRNVSIDLRGYGRSSSIPDRVTNVTDLYVADLRQLFESLHIERAIVVGFASGGHVAIRFSTTPKVVFQPAKLNARVE
jgi:alpha-beta hydrolase superfamily lysophospholipase